MDGIGAMAAPSDQYLAKSRGENYGSNTRAQAPPSQALESVGSLAGRNRERAQSLAARLYQMLMALQGNGQAEKNLSNPNRSGLAGALQDTEDSQELSQKLLAEIGGYLGIET